MEFGKMTKENLKMIRSRVKLIVDKESEENEREWQDDCEQGTAVGERGKHDMVETSRFV